MRDVLCYGDSNTWGCVPRKDPGSGPARRFAAHVRWPGVLRRELDDGYWIVEAGLNGRTTVHDDPVEPHRNGYASLVPTLLMHFPLDLVVVMLGTNDLKQRFGASPRDIADGAASLVDVVHASAAGPDGTAPGVLLVCPPPVGRLDALAEEFAGAERKSRELARHYEAATAARGCAFLDAGTVVTSSDVDGIHLDEPAHRRLGEAVAQRVRQLLGEQNRAA